MELHSPIVFGLETEYGIHVERPDAAEEADVVSDSIALVRCAAEPGVWMLWDYSAEDPHRDMRGFRVEALLQDTDEANYVDEDARRELSFIEVKSDLALGNGGRFYNDHAHPEYCTPECATAEDLAEHDRAGDMLVHSCAQGLAGKLGTGVKLYKNNTDFDGHSYGCHENYLIPRALPWQDLARGIQAFLVTRQVFAGAGKFGVEAEDRFLRAGFQISQRADFFSELQSVETMQRRPLINTRDEPHANRELYRRFHVILGDSNMSSFATRLKAGVTALVLEAIIRRPEEPWPVLEHPLEALKSISRDPDFQWSVAAADPALRTALDVQRAYLAGVRQFADLSSESPKAIVRDWEQVLEDLQNDPMRCRDRIDWAAKLHLIRQFQDAQGLEDNDPWLRSLDLEYHLLDPADGLHAGLERADEVRKGPSPERAAAAMHHPPPHTRAAVRGRLISKFNTRVQAAQWDHVLLEGERGPLLIQLTDLFAREDITRYLDTIDRARAVEDLRVLER